MFTVLIVLAIIVSILLVFIVLIQNAKGGGISANFSAANQIAGVKKTNDFVEKATWTLAIALLVFSLGSRFVYSTGGEAENQFLDRIENSGPSFDASQSTAPVIEEGAPADPAIKADDSEETSLD
jgi:preprotein translocase subunit SecG